MSRICHHLSCIFYTSTCQWGTITRVVTCCVTDHVVHLLSCLRPRRGGFGLQLKVPPALLIMLGQQCEVTGHGAFCKRVLLQVRQVASGCIVAVKQTQHVHAAILFLKAHITDKECIVCCCVCTRQALHYAMAQCVCATDQ